MNVLGLTPLVLVSHPNFILAAVSTHLWFIPNPVGAKVRNLVLYYTTSVKSCTADICLL